jgi:hypothetical protein
MFYPFTKVHGRMFYNSSLQYFGRYNAFAASVIRAMMVAASTSETSVNAYQTTRRYNPEDSHLHTRRRENLRSYLYFSNFLGTVFKELDS